MTHQKLSFGMRWKLSRATLNSGARLLLELNCVKAIKNVVFFTFGEN